MFIPLHDQNKLENVKLQYVTLGLIAINIIIWLVTGINTSNVETANALYYSYGFIPAVLNDQVLLPAEYAVLPEQASYVSYSFFHANFMHLASNMLFLWVFGDNVEDAMGHFRFLIFYLLCAIAGALFHGFAFPKSESPLIGASGAAAGIVAAYVILHPKVKIWILAFGRIPLRLSAMWVIGAWIGFQFINFFALSDSDISWAAHIGGIIAGAILIFVFKRSDVKAWDKDLQAEPASKTHENPPKPVSQSKKSDWGRPDER